MDCAIFSNVAINVNFDTHFEHDCFKVQWDKTKWSKIQNFIELVKIFSKETLRHEPENVYER